MKGVAIHDSKQGRLAFDLKDLLPLLGERSGKTEWQVCTVEATGKGSNEIANLDPLVRTSADKFTRVCKSIDQVIDGTFIGYPAKSDAEWIVIRAVDSTFYEVFSDDEAVLERIRKQFKDVKDAGYEW